MQKTKNTSERGGRVGLGKSEDLRVVKKINKFQVLCTGGAYSAGECRWRVCKREVVSALQPGPSADWAALTGESIWPPRGWSGAEGEGDERVEGEWVEVSQVELRDVGTWWK